MEPFIPGITPVNPSDSNNDAAPPRPPAATPPAGAAPSGSAPPPPPPPPIVPPSKYRPPRGKRTMGQKLLIAGIGVVLLLPVIGIGYEVFRAGTRDTTDPLASERATSVDDLLLFTAGNDEDETPAWVGEQPLEGHPHRAELDRFFRSMDDTAVKRDYIAYADHFNTVRLLDEVQKTGALPALNRMEYNIVADLIRQNLMRIIQAKADINNSPDIRITRIEGLHDSNELLVYVREVDATGAVMHSRWWMLNEDDAWKTYDFEVIATAMRWSGIIAASTPTAFGEMESWTRHLEELFEVEETLDAGELEPARTALVRLDSAGFPPAYEIMRLIMLTTTEIRLGDIAAAERALVRATSLREDAPVLHVLRGSLELGRNRPEAALADADTFMSMVGDDAATQLVRGRALLAMQRDVEAADAYRRGLNEQPQSVDHLVGLGLALEDHEASEVEAWFMGLQQPRLSFEPIALAWIDGKRYAAFDVIADVMDTIDPQHALVAYYRAQAHGRQHELDAAVDELRKAVAYADDNLRDLFTRTLHTALIAAGRPREAYDDALDPHDAFQTIANTLYRHQNPYAMQELIDHHESMHPDDIWIHFHRGRMHMLVNSPDLAADSFRVGLDATVDDVTRETFEMALIESLYEDGRMLDAYDTVGSPRMTARVLAARCIADRNSRRLTKLIRTHREQEPDDRVVFLWDAHISWFNGEYRAVLNQIAEVNSLVADDALSIKLYDELLVRSLVRLDRLDEALDAAAHATARSRDPYFEAIVHAAAGRVAPTIRTLESCVELGYEPSQFYRDDDLGPIIAGEPFAMLHQLYPSPYAETSAAEADGDVTDP
ncbi:MAG: hypothetical protein AAF432_03660 [Planctomycetota bacterium]